MTKKALVFCCKGLGDGLISLILSHNLSQNGYEVITIHPFLQELEDWFHQIKIQKMPLAEAQQNALLEEADRIFIFYENLPHILSIINRAIATHPQKTSILNPIATKKKDYPFWEEGQFDGSKTFVDNLVDYCQNILKLSKVDKGNGIMPPPYLRYQLHKHRVVLHAMSSRSGKNWPKKKFLLLAHRLEKRGYDPAFLFLPEEKKEWEDLKKEIVIPKIDGLKSIAAFIYQSAYLIGNDSGLGHLASCLGIPTVTICRSMHTITFWRPGWSEGKVVCPPWWIPNLKVLRLRDRLWKQLISVDAVEEAFLSLVNTS